MTKKNLAYRSGNLFRSSVLPLLCDFEHVPFLHEIPDSSSIKEKRRNSRSLSFLSVQLTLFLSDLPVRSWVNHLTSSNLTFFRSPPEYTPSSQFIANPPLESSLSPTFHIPHSICQHIPWVPTSKHPQNPTTSHHCYILVFKT